MNNVQLVGRLVYQPEIKETETGTKFLNFRLAVQRNDKAKTTDFINCQAWGQTAEFICNYFSKGDPIDICGKLQTKNYEKKDGTKVNELFVYVTEVSFVPGKAANNQSYDL